MDTDHETWRKTRWEEMTGPQGKAKVVAKGLISGTDPVLVPDVPGSWSTDAAGGLTVTAALADGVVIEGETVDGTVNVPAGSRLEFPGGRTGSAGGANGTYGLIVTDGPRGDSFRPQRDRRVPLRPHLGSRR